MRSSLASRVLRDPTPTEQLEPLRRAAWHQQGVITLRPEEITDEWLRQGLVNLAEKLYGKRQEAAKR